MMAFRSCDKCGGDMHYSELDGALVCVQCSKRRYVARVHEKASRITEWVTRGEQGESRVGMISTLGLVLLALANAGVLVARGLSALMGGA